MIKIRVSYFTDTGKFYTSCVTYVNKGDFEGCIYPRDYGRVMRKNNTCPGIMMGFWKDYFTVEVEDGYPELMMPDYSGLWGED